MDHEDRIRERAHTIWVSEGRLPGREHANWEQAKHELETPNPGQRLESDDNKPGDRKADASAADGALMADNGSGDSAPMAGVDDLNIGLLDDPSNRRLPSGRSKLAGS